MSDSPRSKTNSNSKTNPNNAKANSPDGKQSSLPPDWSYEATVEQVEEIVGQLETGELPLADVFDRFTTAVEQLRQCEAFLAEKRQQVDLLIEVLDDE
ncbi:MAG: exodeoxyribonuclease VII small subunit [Leptolyngbyaceae cyanobacterium MO_188.B28]|nr:exodeoxyribonuclease VII small subunit [Leptolyngbyaceae cyanobacterium MO_188.B28]